MRDRKSDTTHRRVAALKLGRPLRPSEVDDHLNEDKTDQSPANLDVKARGVHTTQHNTHRPLSRLRAALRAFKDGRKSY